MNTNPQQGSQAHQQQVMVQQLQACIRADQVKNLAFLSDPDKAKFTQGIAGFWNVINQKPRDSSEWKLAHDRLMQVSRNLKERMKTWQASQSQGGASQQGADRPGSQGGPAPQQQPSQAQQPQQAPTQQPQQPQVPQHILQEVQKFPMGLPPNVQSGTPEAEKFIREQRQQYVGMMVRMEKIVSQFKQINVSIEQRKQQAQEIPQESLAQQQACKRTWEGMKNQLDEFRRKHAGWLKQAQQQQQQQQPPQQPAGGPQVKAEPNVSAPNSAAQQNFPQMPPSQVQQGPQGQQGQQHIQNQGQNSPAVNPSIEAARNFSQPGRTSMSPATTAPQHQQPNQVTASQVQLPGATATMHPQQQPPNLARPPLNLQQASNMPQPMHGSPQSANPNVQGVAYGTPQQAINASARSYSDQQRGTPQATASQNFSGSYGNRDNTSTNNHKLPIPKTLNVTAPVPVAMGAARPTLGGPANGGAGPMSQPVISQKPAFSLEGDGDRVLSKKKLDELVRQVTGGSEGPGGEILTPEVEEAMLELADEFVDNVIVNACRAARLRESQTLDIRDIQLVLERNYNIRIPGYASDEVRTVRRFAPTSQYLQKMNAVQAAKVMGGKTDI